jgi:hypothetical protein
MACNFSAKKVDWNAPANAKVLLASTGQASIPEDGLDPESVLIIKHAA